MRKKIVTILLLGLCTLTLSSLGAQETVKAQEEKPKFDLKLNTQLHGVLYTRYEYHTGRDNGQRFQVRNARLSAKGDINAYLDYTLQYDFSDEGKGKVVDAFVRVKPLGNNKLSFSLGQMRAPFTLDAHRGPDTQHFNNRSFISRIGGVRDIGFMAEYNFNLGIPMTLQAGAYNGDSFEDQKELRKSFLMYQVKYQAQISKNLYFAASHRNLKPGEVREAMWDGGFRVTAKNFLFEAEYMLQTYAHNAFKKVHYVNSFFCYDILVENKGLNKVSLLARYDYMGDYSAGTAFDQVTGKLALTSSHRSRATAGLTVSIAKKAFKGDIRVNYEKYFYGKDAVRPKYEDDRFVVGFVVSF